jgi:hypothetical protein
LVALLTSALVGLTIAAAPAAPAAVGHDDPPALANGGFERGWFAGWGHQDQPGSSGAWRVFAGTSSPISQLPIPAPPEGRVQAVVDQSGPGSHALFRRISVDGDHSALQLTFWYRNRAGVFFSPKTLRFDRVANQQFRIDIMRVGAGVRSLATHAILATPFRTMPGSPASVGPRTITVDLSRFAGTDVRLRIAEVDNQFFFQAGVDAVRLVDDAGAVRAPQPRLGTGHARPGPAPVVGAYVR